MIVKTLHATANIANFVEFGTCKTLVSEKCMVTEFSCEWNFYFLTVLIKVFFCFRFRRRRLIIITPYISEKTLV